jgi:hypothetical protein
VGGGEGETVNPSSRMACHQKKEYKGILKRPKNPNLRKDPGRKKEGLKRTFK